MSLISGAMVRTTIPVAMIQMIWSYSCQAAFICLARRPLQAKKITTELLGKFLAQFAASLAEG